MALCLILTRKFLFTAIITNHNYPVSSIIIRSAGSLVLLENLGVTSLCTRGKQCVVNLPESLRLLIPLRHMTLFPYLDGTLHCGNFWLLSLSMMLPSSQSVTRSIWCFIVCDGTHIIPFPMFSSLAWWGCACRWYLFLARNFFPVPPMYTDSQFLQPVVYVYTSRNGLDVMLVLVWLAQS